MKFTVRIDGADTGLLERLIAAANRKLAGRRTQSPAAPPTITPPPPTPEATS